jgi:hypothetical protein
VSHSPTEFLGLARLGISSSIGWFAATRERTTFSADPSTLTARTYSDPAGWRLPFAEAGDHGHYGTVTE